MISVTAVPTGHRLYIYKEGRSYENRDPIDTIALLSPTNIIPTDCVCHFAKGVLTAAINIEIARVAMQLGYTRMYITRPSGHKVSRWARFVETADGLDIYVIDDLPGSFQELEG